MSETTVNSAEMRHTFEARDLQVRAGGITVVDEARRVIEMTLATDTPVITFDYRNWRFVKQILTMSAEAMDSTRLDGGVVSFNEFHPLLVLVSEGNQIGVFESVRFEGGKMIATARLSTRKSDHLDGLWHDIKDGIRAGVSIGFKPLQVTIEEPAEGSADMPVMYVNKWDFMEGSLADVPADPNSGIGRSESPKDGAKPAMPVEVRSAFAVRQEMAEQEQVTAAPPAEPQDNQEKMAENETKPPVEDVAAIEARAAAAVEARYNEVIGICRDFRVSDERRDEFLKAKMSADEVRKAVQADWAKQDPNAGANGGVRTSGTDGHQRFLRAVEDGIAIRAGVPTPADMKPTERADAETFGRLPFVMVAERVLQSAGVDTRNMDHAQIAKAAMGMDVRSGILTPDLPELLGNVINRTLARQFELRQPTWMPFAREEQFSDFREKRIIKFGDASPLRLIQPGANIEYGRLTDSGESMALQHYGRAITIDWRAIVNDDKSAFTRLPGMMAEQVRQLHSDTVYNVLLNNDLMEDGFALFSTQHANLAASGTALDDTNIALARKAMRNQKSLGDGATAGSYMNLTPRFLVVGPELEHQANKILNGTIVAATTDDVNLFKGAFQLIVDPRITDKSWYLMADPGIIDGIAYGYLNGRPFWTDMDRNFNNGGWSWKIESSFAADAVEYRGLYKNPGL